jgi:Zn-dependent peptidase ImmA (M78 family)
VKLDKSKIVQIDAAATDVLEETFGDINAISIPVNLRAILERNAIALEYGKFPTSDVSGAFDRAENKIYVAGDDIYARQAFTIAHELGHLLLHANVDREIFYRYESLNLDKEDGVEETEANWFAASLLMPEPLVKKYWNLTKEPKALADIFGVSSTAMFFRLKHLGLV